MTSRKRRRRTPGTGSVFAYKTKAGDQRYGIKFIRTLDDGTKKTVLRRRGPNGETWTKRAEAEDALTDARAKDRRNEWIEPSKQTIGEYLDTWAAGLRLEPSTISSYRKNIRLHIAPYIGGVPLASLTAARIDKMYRQLEAGGRRNGKGELTGAGLSPRTVRYVHTILRAALKRAVKGGLIAKNPADDATPPTAKEARAPEMTPWTAPQLRAFLSWAERHSHLHTAFYVLAHTGMRRGELLALRWRDVDLDAQTIRVQRSVSLIRAKGEKQRTVEGPTKTGKPRVIDVDATTVALLRAHRRERGGLALQLARDDALVFGNEEGAWRHTEQFSRAFKRQLARCIRDLGDQAPPPIRLHDLRHTHATLLLSSGVPVKVVSERLGHASPMITLGVYAHVMPGNQRAAADAFAAMVAES